MKKIIYLVFLITTINSHSQESNIEILEKTISQLNKIETVFHQSTIEAIENGNTYLKITDSIFFDFRNIASTPKYYMKNKDSELIFDGKKHIQSLTKEKLIVTNNNPNANNPLLLTIFHVKELLPKIISNTNIKITRKKDTLINNRENYLFELIYKGGYLDFQKLILKSVPGANGENKYILTINKSDFLPSKFIMPNGPTGAMSRTFDNLDFDYEFDNNIWTGNFLPSEYEKITFDQYRKRMQAKMSAKPKDGLNTTKNQRIGTWKLPNIKSNELVDFSKFKGNVVLLEFWFKFCGPCVKAVPQLNTINEKYKNDKFLLYGIEFREDSPKENLQEYTSKIKMNYPVLYKGKKLASQHSIQAAPTFMIIDKKGNIIYLESGFDQDKIEKIIKENL